MLTALACNHEPSRGWADTSVDLRENSPRAKGLLSYFTVQALFHTATEEMNSGKFLWNFPTILTSCTMTSSRQMPNHHFLWMFPWRNNVRRCWGYLSCPGFTVENAIWILSEVQEDGQNQHSHISSVWNHNWLFLLWVSSILYHFCVPLIVILFSKSFNKHLVGIVIWIGRSFSVMMQLQVQAVAVLLSSAIWWYYIYSSSMFCCVYRQ